MLAGLLFAIAEASDLSDRLVATLPFAGTTLIEHQARQLVAAGATQIVVIGARPTPELLGALHRVGRRGIAVDAVRSVAEAADKLHPLARLTMLADGLVAADATVAMLAGEGGDALLVTASDTAPAGFERVGGGAAWAGIARLDPGRVAAVAALPTDYDPQSALLRAAEEAGAARIVLPASALAEGHGIEDDGAALDRRGRLIVAAAVTARNGWFDRFVAGPLARAATPWLIATGLSGAVVAGGAFAAALAGAVALLGGWPRVAMVLEVAATLACVLAAMLALLREERAVSATAEWGVTGIPLLAVLLLGRWSAQSRADGVPLVIAIVLVAAVLLGRRAVLRYRSWWGSPPAYLLIVAAATIPGWPVAGLTLAACYAGATLAAAIEDLRREA